MEKERKYPTLKEDLATPYEDIPEDAVIICSYEGSEHVPSLWIPSKELIAMKKLHEDWDKSIMEVIWKNSKDK